MDARMRINAIRRQKLRKNIKTKRGITDLRQLITNSNEPIITKSKGSVKTRFAIHTKNKRKNQQINEKPLLSDKFKNVNQRNGLIRVSRLKHDILPKVTIKVKNDNNRQMKQKNNDKIVSFVSVKPQLMTKINRKRHGNRNPQKQNTIAPQIMFPQVLSQTPTFIIASPPLNVPIEQYYPSKLAMDNEMPKKMNRTQSNDNTSVLVTNLNRTITLEDIEELFGEIGTLIDATMVSPTMAVVTYPNKNDAIHACHTYHNRLLDGNPMLCNILPPPVDVEDADPPKRVSNQIQTQKSGPASRKMTSQFFQMADYQRNVRIPRNNKDVQFTVKL